MRENTWVEKKEAQKRPNADAGQREACWVRTCEHCPEELPQDTQAKGRESWLDMKPQHVLASSLPWLPIFCFCGVVSNSLCLWTAEEALYLQGFALTKFLSFCIFFWLASLSWLWQLLQPATIVLPHSLQCLRPRGQYF